MLVFSFVWLTGFLLCFKDLTLIQNIWDLFGEGRGGRVLLAWLNCLWDQNKGYRTEWYISTIIYSQDIPFWSETLEKWIQFTCNLFLHLQSMWIFALLKIKTHWLNISYTLILYTDMLVLCVCVFQRIIACFTRWENSGIAAFFPHLWIVRGAVWVSVWRCPPGHCSSLWARNVPEGHAGCKGRAFMGLTYYNWNSRTRCYSCNSHIIAVVVATVVEQLLLRSLLLLLLLLFLLLLLLLLLISVIFSSSSFCEDDDNGNNHDGGGDDDDDDIKK